MLCHTRRPYGHKNGTQRLEYKLQKHLRMQQITLFQDKKSKNFRGGGHALPTLNPLGALRRLEPRAYGAWYPPPSKILDSPPLCCHIDHIQFQLQLPLNSDKFNLCSCAICRFSFTAHSLTQTECSCTLCPKKYTPWLLTVSCCNLSAILLIINPLNTVRLSTQSSTIIRIVVMVIVRLSRRIRFLVVSASYRRLHKNSLKVRLFLSRTRLDFWFMCVAACIIVSWSN